MDQIRKYLQKEKKHFHKLSLPAQQLLKTITLYELINSILGIFITAFLWRETKSIDFIVSYYILINIGIPLGFYLNGFLLRRFAVTELSSMSLTVWGMLSTTIIYLPTITLPILCGFGAVTGLAIGGFWANRNLLTLKTTTSETRIYFSGIESIVSTSAKIIIPILVGWFIIFGSKTNLYSTLLGYKIIAVLMLCAIGVYGIIMHSFRLHVPPYKQLFLHTVKKSWQEFRLIQVILGFLQGTITVLPVLMVLTLLGQEETLGTVQSIAAILSAFAIYKLTKRLGIKHRQLLLQVSIGVGILGAVAFGIFFSGLGVLIFYATQAVSQPLWWIALSSLNYDLIDKDTNAARHYAYISDQEIYLNGGRIISFLVFLGLAHFISNGAAIRFTPLIFAGAQIGMSFLTTAIEKRMRS